jgi:6-phosphogluconolactonase
MKFGNDGQLAYVLNELSVEISLFTRNPKTGKLTLQKTVSTLPQGVDKSDITCSEIQISHDGKYIYCANRDISNQGRDSLSVFSIQKGEDLALIQTIGAKVHIPRHINLDPSGKWLLVAGQQSNNVPVFHIDPTSGKLSFTGHQITVPKAMCVEFMQHTHKK